MYNKKTLLQAMSELNKAKAPKKPKDIKVDPMGYWNPDNHGKPVRIPSNNITMEGVNKPLLGIANTGEKKIMQPNKNYTFHGAKYVDEYPQMQSGGSTIPVIEDAGSFNKDNIWVPDWSKIKKAAKKLGSKTVKTHSGVIIHFDNNWNPTTVDDNPEMKRGGVKKKRKTRSLSGTNILMQKNALFQDHSNKIYDPTVNYFQPGGNNKTKTTGLNTTKRTTSKKSSQAFQTLNALNKAVKPQFLTGPEITLEDRVNYNLGHPMDKAYRIAERVGGKDNDPIDNFRHPMAGRYTAEALYRLRKKDSPWAPDWLNKSAAWVDANMLGVAHEASNFFHPREHRPITTRLRESAEDIYNNAVGINTGLSNSTPKEKTKYLLNKSFNNELPDGIDHPGGQNMYLKKGPKDRGSYKQDGGEYMELDLTDDEIEEYRKGGYIVEDISVPELNQAQKGRITTSKGKDGTVTNKFLNANGDTVVQVKTKDGKYYEKILKKSEALDTLSKLQGAVRPEFQALATADATMKKDEEQARQKFLKKAWSNYESWPTSDKVSDRVGAFLNDPFGMTARAITGDQAYIPGMGQGLHNHEDPEVRNRYLKELGYTPGEFDASDLQNMINPGYWATSLTENSRKGNLGTAALEAGLMFLPHLPQGTISRSNIRSGANMLKNDVAKEYNKVATGNSFLTDMGVSAWKIEKPNQSIFGTGKDLRTYIAKNATDREAELYTKFGQGMHNLTPEDWAEFEALTKSGATDFTKVNTPISRIPLYYNSSEQAWDEARKLLNLKRGQIYKTPSNKSIRTWSAGIPKGYSAERIARSKPEQKIRLVIPSRYTKNLGNEFAAMPYHDPKVKFVYNENGTINLNAASENELMGNIPGGFKVIGKSAEDGMNNLIIKPVNNSNLFSNILEKLNKRKGYEKGGIITDLTQAEIQHYVNGGYIVEEEDDEYQDGGSSNWSQTREAQLQERLNFLKNKNKPEEQTTPTVQPIVKKEVVVEQPVNKPLVTIAVKNKQIIVPKTVVKNKPIVKTFEKSKGVTEQKLNQKAVIEKVNQIRTDLKQSFAPKGSAKFYEQFVEKPVSKNIPVVKSLHKDTKTYADELQRMARAIDEGDMQALLSGAEPKPKPLFENSNLEKEITTRQQYDNMHYGKFDKRGDDVMNRTDVKRNRDSEIFLANMAKNNSVIIDIGSALGNNDPAMAGVSVWELASNPSIKKKGIKVIATDLPDQVKDFKKHVKNKKAYPIDYAQVPETFNTPVADILKSKKLDDKKDIYLRTANSIDLLMNVDQAIEHLNHISKSLKNKNVTYLYNNVILFKPAGKTTFKKMGNLNNAGFDHNSKSWLKDKNRVPYTLNF